MDKERLPESNIEKRTVKEMGGVNFYSRFRGLVEKHGELIYDDYLKRVWVQISNPSGDLTVNITAADYLGEDEVEVNVFEKEGLDPIKKLVLKKGVISYANLRKSVGETDLDDIGVNRYVAVIYRDVSRKLASGEKVT